MKISAAILKALAATLALSVISACSVFRTKDVGARKDDNFAFKSIPENWSKQESKKAQYLFINTADKKGSVVYANSYCDYYKMKLEDVILDPIKKLGDIQIQTQKEVKIGGRKGIYAVAHSKYEGQAVLLYIYGTEKNGCYYDLNGIAAPTEDMDKDFISFIEGMDL